MTYTFAIARNRAARTVHTLAEADPFPLCIAAFIGFFAVAYAQRGDTFMSLACAATTILWVGVHLNQAFTHTTRT